MLPLVWAVGFHSRVLPDSSKATRHEVAVAATSLQDDVFLIPKEVTSERSIARLPTQESCQFHQDEEELCHQFW